MKRQLNVYLYGKKAGVLSEDDLGYLNFQYDKDSIAPVSVRMPIQADVYDKNYAEPFFDNLTPEGDALSIIADKFHISADNTFSILDKIGGDCAGAISLYYGEKPDDIASVPALIDDESLTRIIESLPNNPLLTGIQNAPRLSLAGAQSKFAVVRTDDNKYYRSNENYPTTHIIKIANDRFPKLLQNELFCMRLARLAIGGNVKPGTVNTRLKQVKNHKYLEIERYDRHKNTIDEKWDNLILWQKFKIERLHQEDFCQVLGVLAKRKYQSDGGPKARDVHSALLKYSSQKAIDSYKFIELMMFNYLIGNTDAHAKNFSLLHVDTNGRIILAPGYDLLSTEVYSENNISHETAMTINGKGKYEAVTKKDWQEFYSQLNLNPLATMSEMRRNFNNIIMQAKNLRDELNKDDLTRSEIYDDIINVIQKRFDKLFA